MRRISYLMTFLMAVLLAACGGGGGSPGLSSGATPVTTTPVAMFSTAPSSITLSSGGSVSYTVSGGVAPYVVATDAIGFVSVSMTDSTLSIVAIKGGSATVVVTDSTGAKLTVTVNVPLPGALFTTAPPALTVAVSNNAVTYSISGGVPPYLAVSNNVPVLIASTSGTSGQFLDLRAIASGSASVTISDAKGTVVTVAVTVPAAGALFSTAPSAVTIAVGGTNDYLVSGGLPFAGGAAPYTATSSNTAVANAYVAANGRLTINGSGGGQANVIIADANGNKLTIAVTVGSSSAFIVNAPAAVSVAAGLIVPPDYLTTGGYLIAGGQAPYTVSSSDARIASATVSGTRLVITGVSAGVATLTVFDSVGATKSIAVTVDGASGASGVSTIDIFASNNTLGSAPGSRVTFTVNVKDASNNAIPKQSVVFSSNGGTLFGATPTPVTDANGTISTVSLSPGADASNRTIRVTATVGAGATAKSKFFDIPVVGTTLAISGVNSALAGSAASSFTLKALDSGGKAISGAQLTVALANTGGSSALSVPLTDTTGTSIVTFTPLVAGKNTLTASGLGASISTDVTVSNEDFAFTAPVATTNMTVSTPYAVTACYKVATVGQGGLTVAFSTTRGTLSAPTALTVSTPGVAATDGCANVTVTSTTAGPVTISGQLTLPTSTPRSGVTAAFVAVTPTVVVLQANPASVAPNAAGATTNYSDMTATVRDASGNPVAGIVVNFTAVSDLSNGSISPGTGTTDSNGIATAKFIPGGLSTATNGVTLRASLPAYPAITPANAQLTVSGQALFISIGRASDLGILDNVTYKKDFSVYVTDASGAPAANRAVALSVIPKDVSGVKAYAKGDLLYNVGLSIWGYRVSPPQWCANEDVNSNGILDAGEDTNTDTRLTPGLPVVVTPGAVTTDANGYASFSLRYGKNFAWWINAEITARASVGGTESKQLSYYLLELDAATATATSTPPNQTSPFGTVASCISPN